MQACALVAALVLLAPAVSACSSNDAVSSGQSTQSGQSGVADVPMSGDYEVGSDGKLKVPASRLPAKPNSSGLILDQHTDVSAETFGRYFIETVEYAWNTGDTTLMSELCASECQSCQDVVDLISDLYSQDGWVDGTEYLIRQRLGIMDYPMSGYDDTKAMAFWVTAHIGNEYDGRVLDRNTIEGERQWELHVVPSGESWVITSMSVQEIPEAE